MGALVGSLALASTAWVTGYGVTVDLQRESNAASYRFRARPYRFRIEGSAVYESSPLQRRLRDLHIAAPHATVQQRHYEAAGKAALAQYRRQFEDPWKLAAQ